MIGAEAASGSTLLALAGSSVVGGIAGAIGGYISKSRHADRQVDRDYELAARKRLYEAIGPLRFQLLAACADLVRRIGGHHEHPWNMKSDQYYGHSFIYRVLRPLAVCELVERQTSYADFSVDPAGTEVLQFQAGAYRMLTSKDPLPYYSGFDWGSQSQHVFRDNLRAAALSLIDLDDDAGPRILPYGEFAERFPRPLEDDRIRPLALLFDSCHSSLTENAVFWTRLVGFSYLACKFLGSHGATVGFETRELDVKTMVSASDDPEILSHSSSYPNIFYVMSLEGL